MNLEIANRVWGEEWTLDIGFIDDAIHLLDLVVNAKVIDIGTGAGVMAVCLALNGFDILTGEPEGEYEAHQEHEGHSGHGYPDWREAVKAFKVENKIRYQHLNAEHLPFPSASFDGVFLYDTLHHIKVLDHIIIGGNRYFSFADEGLIEKYGLDFLNFRIRNVGGSGASYRGRHTKGSSPTKTLV
ncbi:methyltransferase domain-containing protein [Chloroflexota bacterium]